MTLFAFQNAGVKIAQSVRSNPYMAMFRWVSAGILQLRGDLEEALKTIQEAVHLLEPAGGNGAVGRTLNYVLILTAEGWILGDNNTVNLGRTKKR